MTFATVQDTTVALSYIVATVLFIIGLRRLSTPSTARRGNLLAAIGMALAVLATLAHRDIARYWIILVGLPVGAVLGIVSARRVPMTAMPQMVALFNGAGGATAALVSFAEFLRASAGGPHAPWLGLSAVTGTVIGAVSTSGSLVAFGKLQELLPAAPIRSPVLRAGNVAVVIGSAVLAARVVSGVGGTGEFALLTGLALLLGVTGTLPIGGGDMPVVIAVVNSLTGLATAVTGLVLDNEMLIVAGMLVGASGTLLTLLMSRAMNRSLWNVLLGGTTVASGASGAEEQAREARTTSVEDLAIALAYARQVQIIPGYGLAVAQAQRELQAIAADLVARGVHVVFSIHPVAGRMPGHMNVLLAEANVPYERMIELEEANAKFPETDVALVVGANDVVNPAARTDAASPIFGMPILDADRAKLTVVLKRGRSAGFAGIDNALFYADRTRMLYGDAKDSLIEIAAALKSA